MFVSILGCKLGGDFQPPLLLFLDLDVNDKLLIEVVRIESRVVSDDVAHRIVLPDGFLAVRAVDRDVCAR